MKKLAKLMALIMMISTFSGFGALSANAEESPATEVTTYDFNDKTVSGHLWVGPEKCFDATATGAVFEGVSGESGNAYWKVDDEHGVSLAMSGGAGLGFVFNRTFDGDGKAVYNPVTGRVRYSFDVYAKMGDATSQAVLQFNQYTYDWENCLIADFSPKNNSYSLPQTGHGETKKGDFLAGTWYRVDLNIDAKADSATVDTYINGKYQSTRDIPQGIKSVWLSAKGIDVGASNSMFIDNIRVEREATTEYANKVDFNEKPVSAHAWIGDACFDSTSTGAALAGVTGESGNSYQKVDDEHGISLTMTGGAGISYIFNRTFDDAGAAVKNNVLGKFRYSFDMYAKNGDTPGVAMLQFNNETYNEPTQLMNINYASGKATIYNINGTTSSTTIDFAANQWHTIDLDIEASVSSVNVDIYLDGAYVASREIAEAVTSLYLSAKGQGVNGSNHVYVDNIEVRAIGGSNALTAAAAVASITEDDTSAAIRYSGTLSRESVNDEPQVVVSELNKDTGLTREISAYAEIDYTATKLNVYFEDKLNDNCEYTITLPENLTGLFGEETATSSVKVTTKMGMDYADDFEGYSDAAKMTRFNNREFSSAEGFLGGKALTSVYSQNTQYNLSESIVVDNATKDYIVSFDMKIPNYTEYIQLYVNYNSGSAIQWRNGNVYVDWGDAGDFEADKWYHYDFVFDFNKSVNGTSKKLYIYQDGVQLSKAYSVWGTLSWVKLFAEAGYPYHIDNFHARYANEVDVTTNLQGSVSKDTTEATISFDDAVDASALTTNNIKIYDEDLNEVEFNVKSANIYGATLSFAEGALTKNTKYNLLINDIVTYAGEKISETVFDFDTIEIFEVTDARLMYGDVEIKEAAKWDNKAAYTVALDLSSTKVQEQTIYAVVAGYKQSGEFVNVKIAPVTVSVSGTYDAILTSCDMTGADTIKIFAVDGYQNLAPLMKQAAVLN